jgi:hypothetical protein
MSSNSRIEPLYASPLFVLTLYYLLCLDKKKQPFGYAQDKAVQKFALILLNPPLEKEEID